MTIFSVGSNELSQVSPNLVTDASKPHTSWIRIPLFWSGRDAKLGTVDWEWKACARLLDSKSLLYQLWGTGRYLQPNQAM